MYSQIRRAPALLIAAVIPTLAAAPTADGEKLFGRETFGGNGRTCTTCHSFNTGTVSPSEAQRRFAINRRDPLFVHDGSDDGQGHGALRMLTEATILVEIPLPPNVTLAGNPAARSVAVRRGIPTTLNTPALDPVLMVDGREPDLSTQARNAILGHAQGKVMPSAGQLAAIAEFERGDGFFTSPDVRRFARGGPAPELPEGTTDSEKRGRRFFVQAADPQDPKVGACSVCHGGPMLDRVAVDGPIGPAGTRFATVGVSELNAARNPVHTFVFRNPDGTEARVTSPDPGRALITGNARDADSFKISPLRGIRLTAPYFHDNSARTLEEVAAHYARIFPLFDPRIVFNAQDQADMVAYMKLLE